MTRSHLDALLGTNSGEGATSSPPARILQDQASYIDDVGDLEVASDAGDLKVASDGDGPKVASDGGELLSTDSDWGATSGLPPWILLDPMSYIDDVDGNLDCEIATTAEAWTRSWREDGVKVSFFAANPPNPSHFNIYVPSRRKKPYILRGKPRILYSVRNTALIGVTFGGYNIETEYYFYRVVGGQRPSLVHLQYVSKKLREVFHVVSVGVLSSESDGMFVLAALALEEAMGQFVMYVFRSDRGTWTSKVHVLEDHQIGNVRLYNVEKVIPLADGELGFVDLWHGILVVDLLKENLIPRYIPLPNLLPGNHTTEDQLGLSAKYFRDVISSTDGLIKCVEIEKLWKQTVREKSRASDRQEIYTEVPKDVWKTDMLYDTDLMHNQRVDNENENVDEIYEYLGWRFICWSRKPNSVLWRKDVSFHAKDIINTTETISTLGKELNELFVCFPTLAMDGNELYLVSMVDTTNGESRVVVVDLEKKILKKFSLLTKRPEKAYIVCDLFKYMNMPPDDTETCWDDSYLSSTPKPNEESGVIKLTRPCYTILCGAAPFCMIPASRLPILEKKTILTTRILQPMEKSSKGAPVGLQLIMFEAAPVGSQALFRRFSLLQYVKTLTARTWQSVQKPIHGDFVKGSDVMRQTLFTPSLEVMKNVRNENGVMLTRPFLEVCKQILPVLDKFGASMAIVKSDIGGNITRLETKYSSDPSKYEHLYSMVQEEVQNKTAKDSSSCTNGLIWLTRAMDFLVELFRSLLEHPDWTMSQVCTYSYTKTLKYHGWPASSSFKVAAELAPNRDIISGTGDTNADIEKFCTTFSPFLKENCDFLASVGLDDMKAL